MKNGRSTDGKRVELDSVDQSGQTEWIHGLERLDMPDKEVLDDLV